MRSDATSRRKVLIISTDYLGREMAGPAIRCWEFARHLAPEFDVTLAIPNETDLEPEGFRLLTYSPRDHVELQKWAKEHELIVVQGFALYSLAFLKELRKIFVVDLYCPFPIENLNVYRYNEWDEEDRRRIHSLNLVVANEQILIGDFFLCANDRQRDYWLGVLSALNRLNVDTFDQDTTLERMIATVPFGIPDGPPIRTRRVIKGIVPGIGEDDKVIIWAGGIFNWFDPETLVRAMERVSRESPEVKLFFLGTRHPNPEIPEMIVQERSTNLAKDLGLYGRSVFFNEAGYVPYEDRAEYLLDADFGISTHRAGVEARLASRTRFMDYLWAGLPIICTEGDWLAEIVLREGLGAVVPAADPDALADAIQSIVSDPEGVAAIRERIEEVRDRFLWDRVILPLREFCRNPMHAPDKGPERAALPGLHRLHRELELKEGALDLVSEKLETQDQAKRKAEKEADRLRDLLDEAERREKEQDAETRKRKRQVRNLQREIKAHSEKEEDLERKAVHIRNLEAMIERKRERLERGGDEPKPTDKSSKKG